MYRNKEWAERVKDHFICFAAGVLISSPLIMAFPQAVEKNPNAGLAALSGFMFMLFSNKLIKYKMKQAELAFGITALIGIGIHSFIDGIIYSVTFSVSIMIGFLAGIGLVVHEFAEGVITFTALLKGDLSKKKAIIYAFLVAALTTPVGALIAYPFASRLNDSVLGLALGAVSGVLIYLSASHLLPAVQEEEKRHSYLAFLFGVSLALFMMFGKQ
ncbi:MAG: ZIP family metal transporter [Eubacteriales bacterium]|nr:ZIP family metal transporter [Eubacteriales bacterium]